MKLTKILVTLFVMFTFISATDHGMYLQLVKNSPLSINEIANKLENSLSTQGFDILANHVITSPDYVSEEKENLSGFNARLIVFSSDSYINFLTTYDTKYLVGSFLRIGVYQNEKGTQVVIADPETINRIMFNDFWEDEKENEYNTAINKTKEFKDQIKSLVAALNLGENVNEIKEPIRDEEDLQEASADMFMMVGPMTYFTDEDQFPVIYTVNSNSKKRFFEIKNLLTKNISKFQPTENDVDYRWTPDVNSDLKWNIISEVTSPDSSAILLGITRKRTEGVSFGIVGGDDENTCKGLDHICAYPIEVLLKFDGKTVKIYTQREMFRMDMYFWDAGMAAFMDHMSMPGILDEAIKKALLGSAYINN